MSRRVLVVSIAVFVLTVTFAAGQTRCLPATSANMKPDTNNLNVAWTPTSGATSYDVSVINRNTGLEALRASVASTSRVVLQRTSTTPGVDPNTQYDVKITAKFSTCTTDFSSVPVLATAITSPAPPTGISGIGGLLKVTVSWSPAAGATSYQLTLSNGMSFTTTSTSYIVTGLQTATSYNVIVASIGSAGRGTFSNAVAVRTANVALQ
jgi:hypothetical protein